MSSNVIVNSHGDVNGRRCDFFPEKNCSYELEKHHKGAYCCKYEKDAQSCLETVYDPCTDAHFNKDKAVTWQDIIFNGRLGGEANPLQNPKN